MNNLKKLYETPDLEEIVFASRDAIADSLDTDETGSGEEVGDDWFDN